MPLFAFPNPDIQHMQLQPDVGLVLREDLNAVDVAEIGQQGHQVGPGVDDMADAVTGAHQQSHIRLFLPLLHCVGAWRQPEVSIRQFIFIIKFRS